MKVLFCLLVMVLSANAKWETSHFRNGELILFNTETGQAFKEFDGSMIPVGFSSGTEMVEDDTGKKYIVPKSPLDLLPNPLPKKK